MASLTVMSLVLGQACGQRAGHVSVDQPIPLPLYSCSEDGCQVEASSATIDHNWRWLHVHSGYQNCLSEGGWDPMYCPDPDSCAQNCSLEGVDTATYRDAYGVTSAPGGMRMEFKTGGGNTGSRMYILDSPETYKLFKLKNREFALDMDVSSLGCGVNAAVYLVGMDQFGSGSAGARYGTGYCDAQCPHELFIDGTMNLDSSLGSCCVEIDLFEGNKYSQVMTLHPCDMPDRVTCTGQLCEGFCDRDGCAINGFQLGAPNFYGPGGEMLDSLKPFTLVTQFLTEDGTDEGELVQVSRFFLQEGRRFDMMSETLGMSISAEFCAEVKQAGQPGAFDQFTAKSGMHNLGQALDKGMVLVLSIWDDPGTHLRWLDSDGHGPCPSTLTNEEIQAASAYSAVTYANFRYGVLGSTQNQVLTSLVQKSDVPVLSFLGRELGVVPLGAAVAVLTSLAAVAGLRWRHTCSRGLSCQLEEDVDPFIKVMGEMQ